MRSPHHKAGSIGGLLGHAAALWVGLLVAWVAAFALWDAYVERDSLAFMFGSMFAVSAVGVGGTAALLYGWACDRPVRAARGPACGKCGYDLRGNPGAEGCPECGAEVRLPSE